MKKFLAFTVILFFALQVTRAQYTEKRNVSGFSEVDFGVSGEVIINLGKDYSVVLEGDKDYIEDIKTKVYGDELRIERISHFSFTNKKVIVKITMPSLTGVGISGSGKITVNDPLKGDDLDISISGSGKVYLHDVALKDIDCSISGSGTLSVTGEGTIETLDIHISGSGNYVGETTSVGSLEAKISGSGNCDCMVKDFIRASISGSGNIRYSGNPKIDASVSGSGKIRMK